MPRKPRSYLPGVPVHLVQRGRSRAPVFFEAKIKGFDPFNCASGDNKPIEADKLIQTADKVTGDVIDNMSKNNSAEKE